MSIRDVHIAKLLVLGPLIVVSSLTCSVILSGILSAKASAVTYLSVDKMSTEQKAVSYYYYSAMDYCSNSFLHDGTVANPDSRIKTDNVETGSWMSENTAKNITPEVGEFLNGLGLVSTPKLFCYDSALTKKAGVAWIISAFKFWGYQSGKEALCDIGFTRMNGDKCNGDSDSEFVITTAGAGTNAYTKFEESNFKPKIGKEVYDNATPISTISKGEKYYIYKTVFFNVCLEGKSVGDNYESSDGGSPTWIYNNIWVPVTESDGSITHYKRSYVSDVKADKSVDDLLLGTGKDCGDLEDIMQDETYLSAYIQEVGIDKADGKTSGDLPTAEDAGDSDVTGSGQDDQTCFSQVSGLGWILCPVVEGITKLNDGVWGIAEKLLTVNPLEQSEHDDTYNAWKTIRDLANVAFVIVFLITIFSQITSLGISNYGIKKLLPKLIVYAILVNVSYVLAQVVVDLANIVGSSLYNTIIGMSSAVTPTWDTALQTILAGATSATLAGAVVSTVIAPGAAIWLLVPMALTGLLGVLAAMLTLAFRQAAIPILVIMAPLAIVARLMPGTEGLFKKWFGLVKPMLLLYPLAALIFGGARFAAGAINDEGSWFSQIIALIILALPLFSLPFLARNSGAITSAVGGALGKLKNKGGASLKGWGKEHADLSNSKYGAGTAAAGARGVFRRGYQASTYRKMTRKMQTATNNTNIESAWGLTDQGVNAIGNSTSAGVLSKDVKTQADTAWQGRTEATTLQANAKANELINEKAKSEVTKEVEVQIPIRLRMDTKISTDRLKNATDAINKDLKEASTQKGLTDAITANPNDDTIQLRRQLVSAQRYGNIIASQNSSAERVTRQEYLDKIANNGNFAQIAAGIDPNGAGRAQEGAIAAMNKVWDEDVAAAGSRLARENYEKEDLLSVVKTGRLRDGANATTEQIHGALKNIIEIGQIPTINKAMNYILEHPARPGSPTESKDRDLQKSFAGYIAKSPAKEKLVRGTNISDMSVGKFGLDDNKTLNRPIRNINDLAALTMIEKHPSPEGITSMDQDEIQLWAETVKRGQVGAMLLSSPRNKDALDQAIRSAEIALTDSQISAKLTSPQRYWLEQYRNNLQAIPGTFIGPVTPPVTP